MSSWTDLMIDACDEIIDRAEDLEAFAYDIWDYVDGDEPFFKMNHHELKCYISDFLMEYLFDEDIYAWVLACEHSIGHIPQNERSDSKAYQTLVEFVERHPQEVQFA